MEASEVWLRGPIPNIPSLLQPVAHALVQSGEEVEKLMLGFPQEKLWIRPAGVASVGFHLQHFVGVSIVFLAMHEDNHLLKIK